MKKKLGFGLMRLPLTDAKDTNSIDIAQVKNMVDEFIGNGYTYFDTAYIYGNSELVTKEALVKRHPRNTYTLATKLPVFKLKSKAQAEEFFLEQLNRCGVDYFDYYLLHNLMQDTYPIAQKYDCFDFLLQKKKEGKIRYIGFSFHDNAKLLDEILTAYPDMDFVQLQINYIDWESPIIQSKQCYEVAVKHGKKIIVMEPVKGGMLANLPKEATEILKKARPTRSPASWAIRFTASMQKADIILSGFSNMEQIKESIGDIANFVPFSDAETNAVMQVRDIINSSVVIPCTSCRYCEPVCPQNIVISEYFAIFNAEEKTEEKEIGVHMQYFRNLLQNSTKPSQCADCKECESVCPQKLDITSYLKNIANTLETP